MIKYRKYISIVLSLSLFFVGTVVHADNLPTKLDSPNYSIESLFFGGTGTVYSYTASIPPVITIPPSVGNITLTGATVTWTTDKAASSLVLIGTSPGTFKSEFGAVDEAPVQGHTVLLDGLTRGTTYYFKVRSVDVDGNTIESSVSSFQTDPGDIVPPVITTGPTISLDSASLVTVTWETNEISSTVVEYGVKDVTENAIGQADDLTLFHQVHISGLTPSQAYQWRVKTKDASGNVTYSTTQSLATPNSPFISGFSITDITLTSAVVQWSTSTASTTKVEMGTKSSQYDKNSDDTTYTTNHILRLPNLASGTTYYLKVSGIDQAGNLLQSDEKVFATVVVPQITNLLVSNITADSASVTWISSSAIDELIQYSVTKNDDPSLLGESGSGGSDKLIVSHTYQISNLESSTTYTLTVLGKDVFGNQAISKPIQFDTPIDKTPPDILNVKSDTTIDLGSKQTVQVLVSCELSKLGKIVIEYGTGASGPYDKKVETDSTFSRAKFLVIPELVPGQTYHYHMLARDKVGNLSTSPDYLVLAPTQPVSLLDLIFGQIKTNFGWLSNLGGGGGG